MLRMASSALIVLANITIVVGAALVVLGVIRCFVIPPHA